MKNREEEQTVNAFLRRTWAQVHLDRLTENARYIRSLLSPGCRMMGIVKADAYGHGAAQAAGALREGGADWFGVSNLEEAIELRHAGIQEPILVISYTPPEEAARLAEYNITQTVLSLSHAQALSAAAQQAGVTLRVHIKVDTGMARVGFVCHDGAAAPAVAQELKQLCALPQLVAEGIFTHFASADEEDDGGFTEHQFSLFTAVITEAEKAGCHFALRHCCNSAATVRFPQMHLDMVRPGVILYGMAPDRWMQPMLTALQPVMELKTTVSMVKKLAADTPLSYGRTYTTTEVTDVATVPIGYADGYLRACSNRACMLVAGHRVPVLGRVCMDQCMLDVTGIPGVREGAVVTVFGRDGDQVLSADELAAWCGTINYEIVCLISRRVPRLYLRRGQVVACVDYVLSE